MAALVALIRSGLDVHARTTFVYDDRAFHATPAFWAAAFNEPRALEALCAAGADLRTPDSVGKSPLDYALIQGVRRYDSGSDECARVLVANGVRLSTVREAYRRRITPELEAFERGVLRCRAAVVALLRVKRASGQLLVRWDRYLLKQMALDLWATRCAKEWQHN